MSIDAKRGGEAADKSKEKPGANLEYQVLKNRVNERVHDIASLKQFLESDRTKQLAAISNFDSNEAQKVGHTFRIDFHGNRTLEKEITAGHLLPPEIRKISINGIIGTRRGLEGEFYTKDGKGERLKIYTDTQVKIEELGSAEVLTQMKSTVDSQLAQYNDAQKDVARAALERGIDPRLALEAQGSLDSLYSRLAASKKAEMLATQIGRARGRFQDYFPDIAVEEPPDSGIYTPEFIGFVLNNETAIRSVCGKYGYDNGKTRQAIEYFHNKGKKLDTAQRNRIIEELKQFPSQFDAHLNALPGGFDLGEYLYKIGQRESNNNYRARNDRVGGLRGVSPQKWAYGKYQFINQTLKGYGVDLGIPPVEGKVQAFLNNHSLQENIMRAFTMENAKRAMKNKQVMLMITMKQVSWGRVLAAMHFAGASGGLSAIRKGTDKQLVDWAGGTNYTHGFA